MTPKDKYLQEIDRAVAADRYDLEAELAEAEVAYAVALEPVKALVSRMPDVPSIEHPYVEGRILSTLWHTSGDDLREWMAKADKLVPRMHLAKQALDMHDDPDVWRSFVNNDENENLWKKYETPNTQE